jgi:hypothetical protein
MQLIREALYPYPDGLAIVIKVAARIRALEVLLGGSTVPASHDAPSYAMVMTGHFASYRGAPPVSQI